MKNIMKLVLCFYILSTGCQPVSDSSDMGDLGMGGNAEAGAEAQLRPRAGRWAAPDGPVPALQEGP